jgi:anti-sigma regulatory factor (Ser/Thr protein kinase)
MMRDIERRKSQAEAHVSKRAIGSFDTTTSSASEARRFVRGITEQYGPKDLEQWAELLVSELVTNALRYASEPVQVGVDLDGHRLRVEVSDGGETMPRVVHESVWSEHGRGLPLVAALSDRWGVLPELDGKRVWFELRSETPTR